jgi:1-phosphatidylinositol-4-phosphate 5-kinase
MGVNLFSTVITRRLNVVALLRYTVGRITPIQEREVRTSDYGPKANFWMNFPRNGSKLTPSHRALDFKWKDYCPIVFRYILQSLRILFQ